MITMIFYELNELNTDDYNNNQIKLEKNWEHTRKKIYFEILLIRIKTVYAVILQRNIFINNGTTRIFMQTMQH